jgi:hypothetical protein
MKKPNILSTIFGIVTLIITIISAIPSFLSLRQNEALLYYSTELNQISFPDGLDTQRVLNLFNQNRIPTGNIKISLKNNGEGPASKIKVRIAIPAEIFDVKLTPSLEEKPAWVNIEKYDLKNTINNSILLQEFQTMAVGNPLVMEMWFHSKTPIKFEREPIPSTNLFSNLKIPSAFAENPLLLAPAIQVYYDGKEALKIPDITYAPKITWFTHFKVPIYIFIACFVLAIVVTLLYQIIINPQLRLTLTAILFETFNSLLFSIPATLFSAISIISASRGRSTQKPKSQN